MSLPHGGDIARLERELGCSLQGCLDLSTGLSPWSYPVPPVPDYVWQSLPYDTAALLAAAATYYGCVEPYITPVAGVQDAIVRLPYYLPTATVALPVLGYQEHRRAWSKAGHRVVFYRHLSELEQLIERHPLLYGVVINPNNPTTERLSAEVVLSLHQRLANKGCLIVDEAFMDVTPAQSVAAFAHLPGLLVLRSFGKFFGLAGVRLGFVLGQGPVIERLRGDIEPWGVSYPAIWLGAQALADSGWCSAQRQRIVQQADQLRALIDAKFGGTTDSAHLFLTTMGSPEVLQVIYQKAAIAGVLLRYEVFEERWAWLRVGLPGEQLAVLTTFLETL